MAGLSGVKMEKKKTWRTRKQELAEQQELAELIEQQKRDLFFDAQCSVYSVNRRLRKNDRRFSKRQKRKYAARRHRRRKENARLLLDSADVDLSDSILWLKL